MVYSWVSDDVSKLVYKSSEHYCIASVLYNKRHIVALTLARRDFNDACILMRFDTGNY